MRHVAALRVPSTAIGLRDLLLGRRARDPPLHLETLLSGNPTRGREDLRKMFEDGGNTAPRSNALFQSKCDAVTSRRWVVRNAVTNEDGRIVIGPDTASPHCLLFRFAEQTF